MRTPAWILAAAVFLQGCGPQSTTSKTAPKTEPAAAVTYGDNPAAGKTFEHDGVRLYYEIYGQGEPLLVVHGNGGSIADMRRQIAYFRDRYRVIAMDSRDQGKSADSPDKITYEKMAGDLAALLDHLETGPVNVLGWSDGGIEALLLAIRYPGKVKKIVSMAANLDPQGLQPETTEVIRGWVKDMRADPNQTPQRKREEKVTAMQLDEPHIPLKALESITAPVLILASDHDLIRDQHTLDIYHHIPNSQLAIFANATHAIPFDDPARFNATVERFLAEPFVKKDRVQDALKSFEALRTGK